MLREIHGCRPVDVKVSGQLILSESHGPYVNADIQSGDVQAQATLTPEQARYYARKLYQMARRIERRTQP